MHQAIRVQMPRRSWARRTKLGPLALHTSLRQAPSRAVEEKATGARHCWHLRHLWKPLATGLHISANPFLKQQIPAWVLWSLSEHGIFTEGSFFESSSLSSRRGCPKKKKNQMVFHSTNMKSFLKLPTGFPCGCHTFHTEGVGPWSINLQQALRQPSQLCCLTAPVCLLHWLGPTVQGGGDLGGGWRRRPTEQQS